MSAADAGGVRREDAPKRGSGQLQSELDRSSFSADRSHFGAGSASFYGRLWNVLARAARFVGKWRKVGISKRSLPGASTICELRSSS